MSAQWMLFAAQQGVNLLRQREQMRTAGARTGQAIGQARIEGSMERMQLDRWARQDARDRSERLAQAMGSQRAAMGAANVAGGRTARLLRVRSQLRAREAQDRADMQTLTQRQASEFREQQQVRGLRQQARQTRRQARLNLFGDAIGAGQQGMDLFEQQQAQN